MVKEASDLNSSGRLLKVVEISDSRCFFEVCKFTYFIVGFVLQFTKSGQFLELEVVSWENN